VTRPRSGTDLPRFTSDRHHLHQRRSSDMMLRRTMAGLRLYTVGKSPAAAASASVLLTRHAAIVAGAAL